MRLGITGSRHADPVLDGEIIEDTLRELGSWNAVSEVTTGACTGVDALAGRAAVVLFPDALHRVIVPSDRSRIVRWWDAPGIAERLERNGGKLTVVYMTPRTTYRERNEAIIDYSGTLLAFPKGRLEKPFSGTWMTVNIARRRGVPVIIQSL